MGWYWRRCSTSGPIPQPTRSNSSTWIAGDGEARQVCCGAFNMVVGDLIPFAVPGDRHGQRLGDSAAEDARRSVGRHVLLGGRAGSERRRRGNPRAQRPRGSRSRVGNGLGGCHRSGTRRVVGPRGERQSARRHVGGRSGARSGRRTRCRLLLPGLQHRHRQLHRGRLC